ncbi:MAG TPA: lipase maturation factor family protein [Candidatus Aquilonibacter sp.]|nr:lipase maturation factor family protein [Candidatus Aquilonibacter sp.]
MSSGIRVATPPPKPLMVFDGDCNFCAVWIRRWRQITGNAVDYLPFQDPQIAARFPEIPRERFQSSVQLIEPDGTVYSGAEAVFRALAKNPRWRWPLGIYESSPALARFTERAYRFVAGHRTMFSFVTRMLWGRQVERPNYLLTRWIFLRALGVIYLVAFISFWTQTTGLIGHDGILPTDQFMSAVQQQCDAQGIGLNRYHLLPTLCWFDSSDGFLDFQCAAGTVCAILLMLGIAPVPSLALLWLLYLSLTTAGRDFYSFQWDNLLLEAGFLAIFLAPLQWLPRFSREAPPSRIVLWLLRLLLFKLMFSSGCVKLLSGDPNWRNLTALTFHYQTQPLPTWIGWYANQLPLWFQKFSCAGMFAIELGAPWLIFAPRRLRFLGGAAIAFLQTLILLTGNYTFFNFLTLALCLLLLDDFELGKFLPPKFRARFMVHGSWFTHRLRLRFVTIPLALVVASVSIFQVASLFGARSSLWLPAEFLDAELAPLRTINGYGLFAVMTTERREIVVEGSNDGTSWLPYEFKYKPGDVNHRPGFVEPFQPRLDWQMWFAALGNYQDNPWFGNFCERLLQGSPDVLALLEKNPFPNKPPRYIRAELYDYRFTSFAERRATGAWWKRELIGEYLPPVSLPE